MSTSHDGSSSISRRALPHLTFDDGPGAHTDELLDVLARYDVRATFFVLGDRIAERTATVRRAFDEGHAIGNHSWDHPSLPSLPEDRVRDQLVRTGEAIADAIGRAPDVFRPPFGETDATVERIAAELGMRQVLWDVDTEDSRPPGRDRVLQRIATAKPSEVVLLHDAGGDRSGTVAAVEAYLRGGV
jgi:peptidoglycan/xylan/chitin deacetylase (PgdA/CDA1 family)